MLWWSDESCKKRVFQSNLHMGGKNMNIKALVAVRSGSMRVKNKNIRPFAGSTLLEVKLAQLKRIDAL